MATTTSSVNIDLVTSLGADLVIDYKKEDFSTLLKDYDVVLHSNKDPKILENSLKILKKGGILVSLTGPVTPELAKQFGFGWFFQFIMGLLSRNVRRKAKELGVHFQFLFMKANGKSLGEITKLIEAGKICPVIDRVFPFEQVNEAMIYVEAGHSKGKVVVKIK